MTVSEFNLGKCLLLIPTPMAKHPHHKCSIEAWTLLQHFLAPLLTSQLRILFHRIWNSTRPRRALPSFWGTESRRGRKGPKSPWLIKILGKTDWGAGSSYTARLWLNGHYAPTWRWLHFCSTVPMWYMPCSETSEFAELCWHLLPLPISDRLVQSWTVEGAQHHLFTPAGSCLLRSACSAQTMVATDFCL